MMGKIVRTILNLLNPTAVVLALAYLLKPKTVVEILCFILVAGWLWLLVYLVCVTVSEWQDYL